MIGRKPAITSSGACGIPIHQPSLGTYTEGAGCIYVKKLDDINLEVLRRLIAIAWSRTDDAGEEPPEGPSN